VVKAEQVLGGALPPRTLRCIGWSTKHASAFQLLRPSTPRLAKVRSLAAQRTFSELIAQNDEWIRVWSGCFFVGLLGSAGIGAVQHRVPVFGPCLAPRHGAPAHGAELAGQRLFIAFEVAFHRWGFAVQANRSPCPDGLGGASTLRLGAALRRWPEGGKPLFREPWRARTAPASSRDCCV
jgi:hypothetical protein